MAKHRKRRVSQPLEDIPLTPMIDVVFQLLVYFVFTFEPIDIFTHLKVFRPAPDAAAKKDAPPPEVVKIGVFGGGGYTMNDRPLNKESLDEMLITLASLNPNQTIMIMATANSEHEHLITLLDMCSKHGLNNLSVISTN